MDMFSRCSHLHFYEIRLNQLIKDKYKTSNLYLKKTSFVSLEIKDLSLTHDHRK